MPAGEAHAQVNPAVADFDTVLAHVFICLGDRDLVKVWEKKNAGRFDNVMLQTKTVGAEVM